MTTRVCGRALLVHSEEPPPATACGGEQTPSPERLNPGWGSVAGISPQPNFTEAIIFFEGSGCGCLDSLCLRPTTKSRWIFLQLKKGLRRREFFAHISCTEDIREKISTSFMKVTFPRYTFGVDKVSSLLAFIMSCCRVLYTHIAPWSGFHKRFSKDISEHEGNDGR